MAQYNKYAANERFGLARTSLLAFLLMTLIHSLMDEDEGATNSYILAVLENVDMTKKARFSETKIQLFSILDYLAKQLASFAYELKGYNCDFSCWWQAPE